MHSDLRVSQEPTPFTESMMLRKHTEAFHPGTGIFHKILKSTFGKLASARLRQKNQPQQTETARSSTKRIALLSVAILFAVRPSLAHIAEPHYLPGKPEFTDPREVVKIFLEAVDRGELIVFDQRLDRSMIIPVRVEYVYELDSRTPRMKVYSKLKHPLAVPGHPDCRLRGVSAVLDNYGQIIETVAHVWPDETR